MFERFLQLPTGNGELALSEAADLVARALEADKLDVFVHDAARSSLVALGASRQPLSALQKRSGLDVLPLVNGGLMVQVCETRQPLLAGSARDDLKELLGVREVLQVESQVAVPLEIGGKLHGVLNVASQRRDHLGPQHLSFALAVACW